MSAPTFDLTDYVTGTQTSAPITKANFEAILDWCNNVRFDLSNLNQPYHNVPITWNDFGVTAIGTHYALFRIPANQSAFVPVEAQVACSALGGGTLTVDWQVYVAGVWTSFLAAPPLNCAGSMAVSATSSFVAPYSSGIAALTQIRAVVTIAGAAVTNPSAVLFLKAQHLAV